MSYGGERLEALLSRLGLDYDFKNKSVMGIFAEFYQVPALLAAFAVMLWIRLQARENFVVDGGIVFSGNDAWYHLREVRYTVRHWPFTMPYDPWTYYPYGTSVGQFGTLYDQIVATVALIIGLGSPSDQLVAEVLLVAPAVFGALAVFPTYYIGHRLGGRLAGLLGASILMLLPGTFLTRTLVGVADHNGVEPFFQALGVAGLLIGVAVAERETPVWELVVDRDWTALRRPTIWAAIGGALTALYIWVWPPGVLLVGIFGVFALLKTVSDTVNGKTPEPVAFMTAVSMSVVGLLTIVQIEVVGFTTTQFSLLQPLLAFGIAAGGIVLAALAREWDRRGLSRSLYPVAVFGLVAVGFVFVRVALPDVFSLISTNFSRILGFSTGAQTRTIGEAQPFLSPDILRRLRTTATGRILAEYGFTLFTGVAAAVWLMARPLIRQGEKEDYYYVAGSLLLIALIFLAPGTGTPSGGFLSWLGGLIGIDGQVVALTLVSALIVGATLRTRYNGEELLVIVWAAFMTSAAFTQVRFNYYLAIVVAVLNAYLFGQLLGTLNLRELAGPVVEEIDGYQVIAVAAALMLILAPVLIVPMDVRNTGNPAFDKSQTAWTAANESNHGPGAVMIWDQNLQWMQENTPAEGTLGGADNRMEFYGTYEQPPDGDYQYPQGSYGVQSWWDYGHWITMRGKRIPNANPFQQGATDAANFLLAPNETQAQAVLDRNAGENERTRYVMVDWQMVTANSKFTAPVTFYDAGNVSQRDFFRYVYQPTQTGRIRPVFPLHQQRYYQSLMVRLYLAHGSAMSPQVRTPFGSLVVVIDYDTVESPDGRTFYTFPQGQNASVVRTFPNMTAAEEFVQQDGSAQIGGIGALPQERVPALEHYRLVKVSNRSAYRSARYARTVQLTSRATGLPPSFLQKTNPQWVKTFEKVPGARIEGTGARPNETVTATVRMRSLTTNSTFTYRQQVQADENGNFTLVLPYSTTGYAQYGPENGYTNVSVRAVGPYTIRGETRINESNYAIQYGAQVNVSEGLVNGDIDRAKQVELTKRSRKLRTRNDSGGATNNSSVRAALDTALITGAGSGSTAHSSSHVSIGAVVSPVVIGDVTEFWTLTTGLSAAVARIAPRGQLPQSS